MRCLCLLGLSLILVQTASGGGHFDNWYFEFFDGETEMTGSIYSPDGKLVDRGKGTVTASADDETNIATSISVVRFENSEQEVKSVAILKPAGEGKFAGTVRDQAGKSSEIKVELGHGKKFRTSILTEEGVTIKIKGRLTEEGRLVTSTEVIAPDGSVIATVKTAYSKKVPAPSAKHGATGPK